MSQGYEASGAAAEHPLDTPDTTISVRETFGIDVDMDVPAFSQGSEHVPAAIRPIVLIATPHWRFWQALPITAV